jgi:hypothetical protein
LYGCRGLLGLLTARQGMDHSDCNYDTIYLDRIHFKVSLKGIIIQLGRLAGGFVSRIAQLFLLG